MPIYEVEDPNTGQVLELEGDTPPTEAELEQLFSTATKPDFFGASVIEPARTVVSGMANTVQGGLEGIAQSVNPFAGEGAGARAVQEQQAETYQPQTKAGKEGLQTLNDLVQKGVDLINFPLSGLGGVAELVTGQGVDKAAETIKAIQQSGVSKTLGDRAFEETGSPLAATIAETAPTAIGSIVGLKGVGKAANAINTEKTLNTTTKAVDAIFKYQTPAKKKIAALIQEGAGDRSTAKYLLENGRAVKDNLAINAIGQGFDEGVIAAVKHSSSLDKIKMLKMTEIMRKGKRNARYAVEHRPGDVVGSSLVERVKYIQKTNRQAGSEIDKAAQSLKGKPIDISDASRQLSDELDSMGVSISRNADGQFVPNFSKTEIAPGDRAPLKEVIRQMSLKSQDGNIDALSVHKMKRIIDRNVTYGKVKTGMSGDVERMLKRFRGSLDDVLDSNFPEYNAANVKYSDTIQALDDIQSAVGRKLDFSSASADKASGTALRRLMGNTQSRANLIDSISDIEKVAKKYGAKLDDDLLNQALYADELDRVFDPVARTSFQGQIDQAVKRGVDIAASPTSGIDTAKGLADAAIKKARDRSINQERAFQAIIDVLSEKNI
jgi:hypothetical protein